MEWTYFDSYYLPGIRVTHPRSPNGKTYTRLTFKNEAHKNITHSDYISIMYDETKDQLFFVPSSKGDIFANRYKLSEPAGNLQDLRRVINIGKFPEDFIADGWYPLIFDPERELYYIETKFNEIGGSYYYD